MIYQKFTIMIPPVPQGRPRATARGGFARVYEDPKSREFKKAVGLALKGRTVVKCESGPLQAKIVFHLHRPKATRASVIWHTKKPDLDNLAKAVLDAANGILYHDDSQIYSLTLVKQYVEENGDPPYFEISTEFEMDSKKGAKKNGTEKR